jgi:nucleoside phosphorylase
LDRNPTLPCAVILTALPVEYQAARQHLTRFRKETHPQGTIYGRGIFPSQRYSWDIGIVEIGAGNIRAALEAERAITYFKPRVILFIGVAGGLKDVRLGDVVIATKVYDYEFGKANITFQARPEVANSTYRMEQLARDVARDNEWLLRLERSVLAPVPRAFVGPIAAGEKVVSSTRSATWNFLKEHYGDALAVEMEAYGFLKVAHANQSVEALIVRGISDLIDGKQKADAANSQQIAAQNASAFAFEILSRLGEDRALFSLQSDREQEDVKHSSQSADNWGKYNIQFKGEVQNPVIGDNSHVTINNSVKPQEK